MPRPDAGDPLERLKSELKNFEGIVSGIMPSPGEIPRLDGIDIYGDTLPLNGLVGGDHIIYLDFKQRYDLEARIKRATNEGKPDVVENLKRCRKRAGMAVIDASGHQITDAVLVAMLHQAFLLGAIYELGIFGQITKRLFENLNTRFYHSSSIDKYLTMIYGEVLEDATFRFLSAAHPPPVVFSNQNNRFMEVSQDLCMAFPPIGTIPSEHVIDRNATKSILGFKDEYVLNEWTLMGAGDILLIYTDGLLEHSRAGTDYFPGRLEHKIREIKHQSSRAIFDAVREDLLAFNEPSDDITIVVIKRT